jgi:HEAT repeat protein
VPAVTDVPTSRDAAWPKFELTNKEDSLEKMRQLGAQSVADVIRSLLDRNIELQKRIAAASVLGGLRCRAGLNALVQVLIEGQPNLSNACAHALIAIASRSVSRRLMRIVSGKQPLVARQESMYALWQLGETRSEQLFIRLSSSLDTEEEYTRGMATEALGNTAWRLRTQKAIRERLFDPEVSVRYSALCACSLINWHVFPECLRQALEAKLNDSERVDDDRVIAQAAAELLRSLGSQP